MATKQVTIPDIGPVTLYKRRGNRSLRLSISHSGEVRVSLPYWLPYAAGVQFAKARGSWISAQRQHSQAHVVRHGHPIGKRHYLQFVAVDPTAKISSRVTDTQVKIRYPHSLSIEDAAVQAAVHKAGLRALRQEAELLLPPRLQWWSEQTGLQFNAVEIKQLKSRWGSCDVHRDITLNLFLMQLPWHLVDYVLIHELVHTKVMQHGAPFWEEMARHMPDAKDLRKQMAAHRPVLTTQRV